MLDNFIKFALIYQKDLPLQILATYGSSPQILAPLFSFLCLALICLALLYVIYLISNNTSFSTNNYFSFFFSPAKHDYSVSSYSHPHGPSQTHTHGPSRSHSHGHPQSPGQIHAHSSQR